MEDNYYLMVKYLKEIEHNLFYLVVNHKKQKYKIYYTINSDKMKFDIKYIEDIYNDYVRLYNFSYQYKKFNIEKSIRYVFEIIFR